MSYRTGLLVATAFVAGLGIAGPGSGMLERLGLTPGFAQAAPDDRGHELSLFGEVLARVQSDYVEPVTTRKLIRSALTGMLAGLDPHSAYMDPKEWRDMQTETRGRFGGLGMEVTESGGLVKVISPIDGTPAARAGIKPGDLITAADGKTLMGLTLSQAVDKLRGPPDTKVTLTVKRTGDDKPLELTLTREIIHMQVAKSHLYGDIGYVRLSLFNDDTDEALRQAVAGFRKERGNQLRGIVLDLRNNPGGLLDQAVDVADDFLNKGTIVSTHGRHGVDDHVWKAGIGDIAGGLPVVVLVNNGSASASEIVSGALQDNGRALILGTRTFGKGSVQTLFPLRGEGAIRLTTARYYTPDGRSIQGQGITPDVVVHESDTPVASFGPAHETDLNNTLPNGEKAAPPRPPVPLAAGIPDKPPAGWPKFDASRPDTDFQLQQALKLVRALANAGSAPTLAAPAQGRRPI